MASTSTEGITFGGLLAGASLASSQYKIVKFASTAGEVVVGSAATDKLAGVLLNDPADGEEALLGIFGVFKCLAEASVTAGTAVTVSSTGRAKNISAITNTQIGVALDASSSAGDLIRVRVSMHDHD